ncbi:DNA mismatch repair protein [uncultured virus]|nr:DNA mismatch repair protein [uncultured virus]
MDRDDAQARHHNIVGSQQYRDDYSIEYLYRQLEFEKLYGKNTVVFMQFGTFYNVMEYNFESCETDTEKHDKTGKLWDQTIGKVFELSGLMDCLPTLRNRNIPHSVHNLYMFGFWVSSFDRYAKRALKAGYGVVRFDEEITGPKGQSKWVLADVNLPGQIPVLTKEFHSTLDV